jgi:hypothetical protein
MVVIIQIGGVDPHSEAEENPYLHFPLLSVSSKPAKAK